LSIIQVGHMKCETCERKYPSRQGFRYDGVIAINKGRKAKLILSPHLCEQCYNLVKSYPFETVRLINVVR